MKPEMREKKKGANKVNHIFSVSSLLVVSCVYVLDDDDDDDDDHLAELEYPLLLTA